MPSEPPPVAPTFPPIADDPSDEGHRLPSSPSPAVVLEHAASCVRFVLVAFKLELDFTRETLPLLDHYLEQARGSVRERPETLPLVASAAGAYLGEVVRRLHPCWWRADSHNSLEWRLEFRDVHLCFHPVQIFYSALTRPPESPWDPETDRGLREIEDESWDEEADVGDTSEDAHDEPDGAAADEGSTHSSGEAGFEETEPGLFVEDEDREQVRARLDCLPQVSEEEYWAPSTRLEVVDIVVEAIQANLIAHPLRRRSRGPEDYE
jgi:hypothetical protein